MVEKLDGVTMIDSLPCIQLQEQKDVTQKRVSDIKRRITRKRTSSVALFQSILDKSIVEWI